MKYFRNFSTIDYDMLGDGKTRQITDVFRKARIDPRFLDDITFYTYYTIRNGERPDTVSYKLYGRIDYHWTFGLLNPTLLEIRNDWPMNTIELQDYVYEKYPKDVIMISDRNLSNNYRIGEVVQGLASNARGTILSKDPNLGYIVIDKTNSNTFISGELALGQTSNNFLTIQGERKQYNAPHHYSLGDGTIVDRFKVGAQQVTNYEHEIEENEKHTRIKVIRPELVQVVAEKFISTITQ